MKLYCCTALAMLVTAPAQALIITPFAVGADATAKTAGGNDNDSQIFATGTASATATSNHTVTYPDGNGGTISTTDSVTAAAYQRDDGFSYIELKVDGDVYNVASTGTDSEFGGEASTVLALHYYNDGVDPVSPIFNFTLSSIAADTATFGDEPVEAEISFDAYVSGGGDSFSASATARSSYNQAEIVDANNMSGTVQPYECDFGVCFRAAYIFDDITDALLLGVLNPGEWVDVIVEMGAKTSFRAYEEGAYARIRDPNGGAVFAYSTTFDNLVTPPAPAPVPATWLLLIGGLAAVRRWFMRTPS